jgi:hypothetical protein
MDLSMLLNDHQLYHSELQQDHFITRRSGGTIYGQYKQALRELFKRFRGLKELYYNRETLIIDTEEMEDFIKVEENKFNLRRKKLEIEKFKYDMIELKKNIDDTEREFKRFFLQASSLKEIIGDLTDEKRNKLDKEMWIFKLKEMAYTDFISSGRLNVNTIAFIHSLEKKDRLITLAEVTDHDRLFAWYENKDETYEIKDMKVDVNKLVSSNNYLLE